MFMSMMFVIVDMFMGVLRRRVSVFRVTVAMRHFLMFVLMEMLVFFFMLVSMMFFVMGVLVSVLRRLVSMFRITVAMGHFLMGVFMLMLVFLAHGLSLLVYFAAGQSVNCAHITAPYSTSTFLPSWSMAFFSTFMAEKPHQPALGTANVKTPFLSVLTTWV